MFDRTTSVRAIAAALIFTGAAAGAQTATLSVSKTFDPVSLGTSMAPTAAFPVKVVCTPGVTTTIVLNGGNQFHVQMGVPVGTSCTVAELTPQNAPLAPNCQWSTVVYPKGTTVTMPTGSANLEVRNAVTCATPASGSLKVLKYVINQTGPSTPIPPAFTMAVDCTPSGLHQSLPVSQGSAGTTIGHLAAPSHCTVTEPALAPIARADDCLGASASWTTVITPAQPVTVTANATTTVKVVNTLTCDKPAGFDVRIVKLGEVKAIVGGSDTFTLRPANVGPGSVGAGDVTIVDTLPAMFSAPISASGAPDWNCTVSGSVVSCAYNGMAVGANQSMTQIIVTAFAGRPGNGQNCAWINLRNGQDLNTMDNRSCLAVTVAAPVPAPTLTVRKILIPASDIGKFNLLIDGISKASAVGNNGTTGAITTTAGTHAVSEVASAASGSQAGNYSTVIGGDCNAAGSVVLVAGDNKTCTLTNTRRAQLKVVKLFEPANASGMFNLFIDGDLPGGVFGTAANVGNNGTTGFITVDAGAHLVSEAGGFTGAGANGYTTSYSANCAGGHITLQPGTSATCTITNTKSHGSFTQGPGMHVVTLCSEGTCDIHGTPGQQIPLTIEVWGAGGGGGTGQSALSDKGGSGGGGGGGGGYGKVTITVTVPTGTGVAGYYVEVGVGGTAGSKDASQGTISGGAGGYSEVRLGGNSYGTIVMKATGGGGGTQGIGGVGASGAGGLGGSVPSSAGNASNSVGLVGANGVSATGCNGGGGGNGGVGGGPGAINNGGHGGHGGYYNAGVWLIGGCTAQSYNNAWSSGLAGGNGLVKLAW